VQINWESSAGLPEKVQEKIDYNGDGKNDFFIDIDTKTGTVNLAPYSPSIGSIEHIYKLKKGWAVRVHLKRG
jgi:hypothetical protein